MGGGLQVNAFAEGVAQGKGPFALYTDPGTITFVTFPGGETSTRGSFTIGTQLYAVAGEHLYKVAASGATTLLGVVLGVNPIIASANKKNTGPQVSIVADSVVYILENDILIVHPDPDLPPNVHSCCNIDGYTIYGIRDGRYYISSLNEATAIDALDFAEAEGDADNGVRVTVLGRDLLYFGEETLEISQNTGNALFPFERLPGGFISIGSKSKYASAKFDNTIAWVDSAGRAVRLENYTAVRFSTHGVEKDIQRTINAQRASEMEAFTYREGGHEFYVLSGPDWTWVYDAASQLWHPKQSYGLTRTKIRGYVRSADRHIVGDLTSGKLHIMSMSAFDESGGYLVTTLRSPVLSKPGVGIIWDSVLIDIQTGVGRVSSDLHASDPQLILRWSDDAGASWSKQRTRPMGKSGVYGGSMLFSDLGSSGQLGRIYEAEISAPVERCVVSASAVVRYVAPA